LPINLAKRYDSRRKNIGQGGSIRRVGTEFGMAPTALSLNLGGIVRHRTGCPWVNYCTRRTQRGEWERHEESSSWSSPTGVHAVLRLSYCWMRIKCFRLSRFAWGHSIGDPNAFHAFNPSPSLSMRRQLGTDCTCGAFRDLCAVEKSNDRSHLAPCLGQRSYSIVFSCCSLGLTIDNIDLSIASANNQSRCQNCQSSGRYKF